jgi:hypothetical protein
MQSNPKAYDEALKGWRQAENLYGVFLQAVADNDEANQLRLEQMIREMVTPSFSEHWKSRENDPKFYVVYGVGVEQDVHNPLVAYTSLYGKRAGHITFRHLINKERGFLTPIDRPSVPYTGPRFSLIRPLSPYQCLALVSKAANFVEHCQTREQVLDHVARTLGTGLPSQDRV